jgi:hypothetical protein
MFWFSLLLARIEENGENSRYNRPPSTESNSIPPEYETECQETSCDVAKVITRNEYKIILGKPRGKRNLEDEKV